MTTPSPLKTVFGFVSRNNETEFPRALLTIVESKGDYYAIQPTGSAALVVDEATGLSASIEEIASRKDFIVVSQPYDSDEFNALTSYAFATDFITVGTPQEIAEKIDLAITCDQASGDELEKLETDLEKWTDFLSGRSFTL